MPGYYEIRWSSDGRTQKFPGSRGNYYKLEDGSHLDVVTEPVWCRQCREITHGEDIEPLAEIEQRLADLHDPTSELYKYAMRPLLPEFAALAPRDEFRLGLIEEAVKRRGWREQRRSGPKCIVCGSTDVVHLPLDQQVPNPGGAGTVQASVVGMCGTNFNEWYFTPEGDRIKRDTRPTYWHHPQFDEPEI